MTAIVKSINGSPIETREIDPVLVEALEDLLIRAKSGSLRSLYSIGFSNEGELVKTKCHNEWNPYQVVGALAVLQSEFIRDHAS